MKRKKTGTKVQQAGADQAPAGRGAKLEGYFRFWVTTGAPGTGPHRGSTIVKAAALIAEFGESVGGNAQNAMRAKKWIRKSGVRGEWVVLRELTKGQRATATPAGQPSSGKSSRRERLPKVEVGRPKPGKGNAVGASAGMPSSEVPSDRLLKLVQALADANGLMKELREEIDLHESELKLKAPQLEEARRTAEQLEQELVQARRAEQVAQVAAALKDVPADVLAEALERQRASSTPGQGDGAEGASATPAGG